MNKEIKEKYNLVIIGAGPAGLTASVYASRYGIDHLVVGSKIGGEVFGGHEIGNFPGLIAIKGTELTKKIKAQVESFGAMILNDSVDSIARDPSTQLRTGFKVQTLANGIIEAKTVLLAIGTKKRELGVEGEKEFLGKGVSYCVHCDGAFFKGKDVAVVGGGDSAITAALYLSDISKKVYVINRSDKLKVEKIWKDKLNTKDNVEILLKADVAKITGQNVLKEIVLDNGKKIQIDGLFVEIGSIPELSLLNGMDLRVDKKGHIQILSGGETNVDGIWAAGDITNGSNNFRQIITACSEGAIAVNSIHTYLSAK